MLFDADGNPLKTLSRAEKINLGPGSSLLLDKWGPWEATDNERKDYKTSISFVNRVQNSERSVWVADTQAIAKEVQELRPRLRSRDKS